MHDLGTLGGTGSDGYALNNLGHVTGKSDSKAFLYTTETGMEDLNTLIDPLSGWTLEIGQGINDAGQITGTGYVGDELHAFLLTPVPEPGALTLLASATVVVAAMGFVRRRHAMRTIDLNKRLK